MCVCACFYGEDEVEEDEAAVDAWAFVFAFVDRSRNCERSERFYLPGYCRCSCTITHKNTIDKTTVPKSHGF